MSETPKVGDKVRVAYEGTVVNPGFGGLHLPGTLDMQCFLADVEILERADDPSKDPVGTVRQSTAGSRPGAPYIKTAAPRYPWKRLEVWQSGEQLHGNYNESMVGWPIIGVVPGSPADKPEVKFYQSPTTELRYRVQGNKAEFFSTDDGIWYPSFVGADTVRSFTRLDSDPTDGR